MTVKSSLSNILRSIANEVLLSIAEVPSSINTIFLFLISPLAKVIFVSALLTVISHHHQHNNLKCY